MTLRHALLLVGLVALLAGNASGQESIQAAKDLYASAAYEDALAVLTRLSRSDSAAEVHQYRAFCLIALGRLPEAEKAIEMVVAANPRYAPGSMDVSPRVQEVFTRTRRQLLPEIAKRMYTSAKEALNRKDREAAVAGFGGVVELIDAAEPEMRESLDEVRFLAAGFLDLSRALRTPESDTAKADVLPVAPTRVEPRSSVTPPVAIRQVMPPWVPLDAASRQTVFTGAIRVNITQTGQVEGAEMVRSVHPAYDRLLLSAVKTWEYQPARRNGQAVPSDQVVEVQLKPRQ